jgi:hypothetical protein
MGEFVEIDIVPSVPFIVDGDALAFLHGLRRALSSLPM